MDVYAALLLAGSSLASLMRRIRSVALLLGSLLLVVTVACGEMPGRAVEKRSPESPALAAEQKIADVPYVNGGKEHQRLDLYLPAGNKMGKVPLVIWIHGGGWTHGSKENPPGLSLLKKGYAVASVNYRYSTEAVFPAQIQDCKAAVRWLRANADKYGFDASRIGVWGGSAGGHLAALLAVTGDNREFDVGGNLEQSSAVQCVIDWFGPTDFAVVAPSAREKISGQALVALSTLFGGAPWEHADLARKASPMQWANRGAAPILIMHGSADPVVPVDQSQRFGAKLKELGAEVTVDILQGAGHGGPQFFSAAKLGLMEEFLARHLGGVARR